MSLKKQASFST